MPRRWETWLLCLLFGLILAPGCTNEAINRNPAPSPPPPAVNVQVETQPSWSSLFAGLDPGCRITVRSLQQTTNAVRNQIVLIATVTDKDGRPVGGRQVDWLVQGAGNILEVDERGLFHHGHKIDNSYAVSYTERRERLISRFTGRPKEDFKVGPGESWCVVQSAAEGDTNVTVYAQDIANHDNRTATMNLRWVDAEWTFPELAVCRAGASVVLTTSVFRHTDHLPLAGYKVRYRYVDGPSVLLGNRHPTEEVATTDLSGFGGVSVSQSIAAQGRTRLNVQIIRPPDPSTPSGAAVVIGEGEAFVDWQSAQVTVSPLIPTRISVGQDVPYTLTLNNSGPVSAQTLTVRAQIPDGMELRSTTPPTARDGDQIVWTLGELASHSERKLTAVFRPIRAGTLVSRSSVVTGEGLHDEKATTFQVQPPPHPQLDVQFIAPPVVISVTGTDTPFNCQLVVSNPGTGPTTNTVVQVAMDPGTVLEHATRANPIKLQIGELAPGEKRPVPFQLLPRQAGRATVKVIAVADGNLSAKVDAVIEVQEASLQVKVTGPANTCFVGGKAATWNVEVSNAGKLPVTDVVVRCQLPVELGFTGATEGGRLEGREVVWRIATLKPDERKPLQFNGTGTRPASQVFVTVLASGRANGSQTLVNGRSQASVEVKGLTGLVLQVKPRVTPIEMDTTETVDIVVRNEGTVQDENVQVTVQVPPEFKIVSVQSAGTYEVNGQEIKFTTVPKWPANTMATFTVLAQPIKAGPTKFTAIVTAKGLDTPMKEETPLNVH